ncbi:hypothetical protein [Streptomyces rochei]|uniref:hypothetical protein n=1 Tax=Streptomyces rochei TaxID=1928 RepID=UPI0036F5C343
MTSDRHLALMALMREITAPAKTYERCVRRAAAASSTSPEHDKAVALGNSALDDIERAVRYWVAEHPEQPAPCGRNRSIHGNPYPPCALPAGHPEAYCRSADGNSYFLGRAQ